MTRSMEDQLIAKFASFRAGMRQWERRINDEELAERDNFLKWFKGAFRGGNGGAPLDDPAAATGSSRKRQKNNAAIGGPAKRRRSARVRARVNYREDIPKDEDAILQILEEADMLEKDSKFDVSEEAAFTPEEDNQGDDQDCEDTGSTASADREEGAQGPHEIDVKATLKKLKADREYVQAWINHESSKKVATAKGLTPQIAHLLEHMTRVMEDQVASRGSPKNIIRETKKAYAEFEP